MKRKFLFAFSVVLTVTIVSLIFTTTSIDGRHPKNSESAAVDTKVVIVQMECNSTVDAKNKQQKHENDNNNNNEKRKPTLDYLSKYPSMLTCRHPFNEWHPGDKIEPADSSYEFSRPAEAKYHEERVVRGVLVYFPIGSEAYYRNELKWLYRSWIHMLKFEPAKWRTDLIVFVERDEAVFNASAGFFMNELNCRFENLRHSVEQKPMCTLINYVALKKRPLTQPDRVWSSADERYQYLLRDVDIFKPDNAQQLDPFYKLMKQSLSEYGYLDSILMAFEGYFYLSIRLV